ncbi:hypothetical protein C0992_008640 [Termitomyces sp. T32_za158]|nr:hypothetical protein C0992_008640 [Termitomyces sp. T32_za158]
MEKLDISIAYNPLPASDFASIAGSIHPTTSKHTNRYHKSSTGKYVDHDACDGLSELNGFEHVQSRSAEYYHYCRRVFFLQQTIVIIFQVFLAHETQDHSRPNYLPQKWSAHIHPEGQPYFYKNATIRVVTEAYVCDGSIMEKVEHWIQVVENLVQQKQTVLPDDVELFIQIEDNDCFYYFIDHRSRTEFWLDNLDTNEIGLEPVASPTHLG